MVGASSGNPTRPSARLTGGRVAELLVIAAVLWTSRYWHHASFGLYEDDYTRISAALGMSAPEAFGNAAQSLSFAYEHGKPLHSPIIYLLAYLGSRIAGLTSLYWLGYLVLLANAVLLYLLVLRLSGPLLALTAGLAFSLNPSDTTQALLTHSFGLQPSLLLLLLAFHSYLSKKRLLAYILAAGILLVYETPFPVFVVAPMLVEEWDRKITRKIVAHVAVLGGILAAAVAIRILVGETRVSGLGLGAGVLTPIVHMIQGPAVSLGTFLYRPVQALLSLDGEIAIAIGAGALALFGLLLVQARGVPALEPRALLAKIMSGGRHGIVSEEAKQAMRLALVGLLMLVLAYPLTFTVRAYAISGRDTRVHFAAVLGASILWGVISWFLLGVAESWRKRWLAAGVVAAILGALLGFGFVIQRDYVRSWDLQRSFWSEVVRLCPDLEDGVVILVDPDAFEDTRQIAANHWNLPRVLDQIYLFPGNWDEPPRVYRLLPGWEETVLGEGGALRLDSTTVLAPSSLYREVESTLVILLLGANGSLERAQGPLVIAGRELPLKPLVAGTSVELQPGFLYPYLVEEVDRVSWIVRDEGGATE